MHDVLESALAERDGDEAYVFWDAASMVIANPDGLTWRFKKLAASVLPDPYVAGPAQRPRKALCAWELAGVLPEVMTR